MRGLKSVGCPLKRHVSFGQRFRTDGYRLWIDPFGIVHCLAQSSAIIAVVVIGRIIDGDDPGIGNERREFAVPPMEERPHDPPLLCAHA